MSEDEDRCAQECFDSLAAHFTLTICLSMQGHLEDPSCHRQPPGKLSDREVGTAARQSACTDVELVLQGVWEKDEIRKDDSFVTFEEILQIAQQQAVDLVLLGGDLFHDNKPSRSTIVRAIDILTRYTLSDKPVAFQVVSDQSVNFVSR